MNARFHHRHPHSMSNPHPIVLAVGLTALLLTPLPPAPRAFAAEPPAKNPDTKPPEAKPQAPETPGPTVLLAEGQLYNSIGAGEEGVKVTLRLKTPDGSPGKVLAMTTTDDLGDFKLMAFEPTTAPAVIIFEKPGLAPMQEQVQLGEGEFPPFVDMEVQGNLHLTGTVVDARGDKPIPNAKVVVNTGFKDWEVRSESNGVFRLDGLFAGPLRFVIEATGFGREQMSVTIHDGENTLTVRLKPERIVHLKTVGPAGRPVAGVTIEAYDPDHDDFRTIVTDDQGQAELAGLNFDTTSVQFRLTHPEFVSSVGFDQTVDLPADKAESDHSFTLARAGRIEGTVIDAATRRPVSGVRVVVGEPIQDQSPRDFTDYTGAFTVGRIPPGPTVVTAHGAGYAPELLVTQVQTDAVQRVNVKLHAGRTVSGVVLDHTGKPASGVLVTTGRWRDHETLGLQAMTDDQGRFQLPDAPLDAFDLVARSRRGAEGNAAVTPDKNDVRIQLPEPPERPAGGVPPNGGAGPAPGDPVPDFEVTTLDGRKLTPASLKGRTVLLDFWATWCGPCVGEVPNLVKVHDAYAKRDDFVIISISLDRDEAALKRFIEQKKMTWNHVFGQDAGAFDAADTFSVRAIPAMFLIDRDGKIIQTNLRGPDLKKAIDKALQY